MQSYVVYSIHSSEDWSKQRIGETDKSCIEGLSTLQGQFWWTGFYRTPTPIYNHLLKSMKLVIPRGLDNRNVRLGYNILPVYNCLMKPKKLGLFRGLSNRNVGFEYNLRSVYNCFLKPPKNWFCPEDWTRDRSGNDYLSFFLPYFSFS